MTRRLTRAELDALLAACTKADEEGGPSAPRDRALAKVLDHLAPAPIRPRSTPR